MANPLADALMNAGPLAAPELKRSRVLEDAIGQLHNSYKNGIGSKTQLVANILSDGLLTWGKTRADKKAVEGQAKDDAGLADFYSGVLSPQQLTQASAPSGPIDISPPPVGQEAPPPQPMPQQAPQQAAPNGVDPQMIATLKTMLSHPDPRVRQQGQMMAQEALAKMYAPPETALMNTADGVARIAKEGPEGLAYKTQTPKDPRLLQVGNQIITPGPDGKPEVWFQGQGGGGDSGASAGGIDIAAQSYLKTGKMPALGAGSAALRVKILNRSAELAAQNGDSATAAVLGRETYAAASGALKKMQQQRTMVGAFEKTALANLNLALQESEKVDRGGSPAINRWVNAGKKTIAGDVGVARFHTALTSALNEYAKVLSGATGAAGISDAARAEAESLLSTANSPAQVRGVMDIMRKEMANREAGFEEQEQELMASMGGDAPAPAAGIQQPPQPAQPAPRDPTQRVPNTVYMTPKGPHTWTGTGWAN